MCVDTVQQSKYVRALYAECWNKLWMWEWEEFSRLVYLDADMVLCRNVDHLFTLPPAALYAVGDCYGGRETQEERSACCHFTPDAQPQYFNAGFYVMTPNKAEFAAMHAALAAGSVEVGRFAEQDFLNGYFNGRWRPLPYIYNAQKRIKYHHPNLWDLQHIAVIHYVDDKPWNNPHSPENMAYQDIVEYWWRVYGQGTEGEAKLLGVGAPGEKDTKDAAQAVGLHAPLGLMSKKSTNAVSLHAPLGLVVLQSCEVEAVQQRAVVAVHGAGAQASEGGLGNRS